MLIGVKKRFVFIANSKTASTTIEELLTPYAEINRVGSPQRKHIRWSEVRREYDFLFGQPKYSPETFFKFGVVREPADWIRSWFNYRVGNIKVKQPLPANMNFEEFWRSDSWLKKAKQKTVFTDGAGECVFDLVIPHDELNKYLPIVLKKLKVNVDKIKEKNKSPGGLLMHDISSNLIDEINQYYSEDHLFYMEWKGKIKAVSDKLLCI